MEEHALRLKRMRGALERTRVAGALLTRPEHGLYLTGCPGAPIVVGPSRVARLDGVSVPGVEAFDGTVARALGEALRACGLTGRAIGVEARYLPGDIAARLEGSARTVDVEATLAHARAAKDAAEIAQLASAVALLERAHREVADRAREGRSGMEMADVAMEVISAGAGRAVAFAGNLGAGPSALDPDSAPSPIRFRRGETFFLDLYPDLGGYSADVTRCFSIGPAPEAAARTHAVLERALASALAAIRPGVRAWEVDAAVRRVFDADAMLPYFAHHSGHGLGLFLWEPPLLLPGDDTPLTAGMVLAVEPGLYVPGVGGFRLEVNVCVTGEGCLMLGDLPAALFECART
jgi:Xaa-Pro aminopeptidase